MMSLSSHRHIAVISIALALVVSASPALRGPALRGQTDNGFLCTLLPWAPACRVDGGAPAWSAPAWQPPTAPNGGEGWMGLSDDAISSCQSAGAWCVDGIGNAATPADCAKASVVRGDECNYGNGMCFTCTQKKQDTKKYCRPYDCARPPPGMRWSGGEMVDGCPRGCGRLVRDKGGTSDDTGDDKNGDTGSGDDTDGGTGSVGNDESNDDGDDKATDDDQNNRDGNSRAGCYWDRPQAQDFSNDGRTMVFNAMSENIVSGSNEQGSQLYIFDTVKREMLKLTDERNVSGIPLEGRDPKISGNGKYIAFVGLLTPDDKPHSSYRMMLMNLETHAVTEISSWSVFYGPSDISDDGRYVLYRENCLNLYDREKDSTVLISGFARDVSGRFISGYCTKAAKNPTTTDPLLTDRNVRQAFITPDGKTVFFSAFNPETRMNSLYRYNVDGTSAPWEIGSLNGGGIVMNRDRTLMFFENVTPDSRRSIHRQPTNMSTKPELVNPGNNAVNDGGLFLFSTSGDGRKISLVGGQGQHLLVFDGSSTIDLGPHTMPSLYAPLSPDGRWISFTDKGQGTFMFRKSLFSKSSLTIYDLENRKSIFVAKPGMTCPF